MPSKGARQRFHRNINALKKSQTYPKKELNGHQYRYSGEPHYFTWSCILTFKSNTSQNFPDQSFLCGNAL